eukprot:Blabericola_migrator_1__12579@NODE_7_length_25668_cov_124_338502_g6_i0_p1_GENE_NODE_7_length_25668_cov_124_338502_g6_i0NODE_7_length_25668_cov_124_338502_g6_i0_p1_ORF_typecomplete_len1780_score323_11DUF2428/PF10350_9/5_3e09DUF2428/PF10350_9/1_7e02_NODE_7_length_25668_cov_124_338502_g6_i0896614305
MASMTSTEIVVEYVGPLPASFNCMSISIKLRQKKTMVCEASQLAQRVTTLVRQSQHPPEGRAEFLNRFFEVWKSAQHDSASASSLESTFKKMPHCDVLTWWKQNENRTLFQLEMMSKLQRPEISDVVEVLSHLGGRPDIPDLLSLAHVLSLYQEAGFESHREQLQACLTALELPDLNSVEVDIRVEVPIAIVQLKLSEFAGVSPPSLPPLVAMCAELRCGRDRKSALARLTALDCTTMSDKDLTHVCSIVELIAPVHWKEVKALVKSLLDCCSHALDILKEIMKFVEYTDADLLSLFGSRDEAVVQSSFETAYSRAAPSGFLDLVQEGKHDVFLIVLMADAAAATAGKSPKGPPLLSSLSRHLSLARDVTLRDIEVLLEAVNLAAAGQTDMAMELGPVFRLVYPASIFPTHVCAARLLRYASVIAEQILLTMFQAWAPRFIDLMPVLTASLNNLRSLTGEIITPTSVAQSEACLVLARIHRKFGSHTLIIPGPSDSIWGSDMTLDALSTDWALKSNVKTRKKQAAKEEAENARQCIENLKPRLHGNGFIVILCDTYVAFPLEVNQHKSHLLSFLAADRRQLLPFRSPLEARIALQLIDRQLGQVMSAKERATFLASFKRLIARHVEVLRVYLTDTPLENASPLITYGVNEVLLPFARQLFRILTDYCDGYPHVYSACALQFLTDAAAMLSPETARVLLMPSLETLHRCTFSDWDDIRLGAESLIRSVFTVDDLLDALLSGQTSQAALFIEWIMTFVSSPKLRDFRAAVAAFKHVSMKMTQSVVDPIVITAFEALGSNASDTVEISLATQWLEAVTAWIKGQVAAAVLPAIHGSLLCLDAALESVVTLPTSTVTVIYRDIIEACLCQFLSFIALGENRVLLSQASLPGLVDLRVDCRGHLVFAPSGGHSCEATTDETLPHPSSFSRFWMTIENAGQVMKTLLSKMDVGDPLYGELTEKCCEILLTTRHPGLLEVWSEALATGILRLVSNETRGANRELPLRLTIKVLNSILPGAFFKLYSGGNFKADGLRWPECAMSQTLSQELLQAAVAAQDLLKSDGPDFVVVPNPLRKSTSLCALFEALFNTQIFVKPKEHCVQHNGVMISHHQLATAVVARLLLMANMNEAHYGGVERESVVSSKFHALNILRSCLKSRNAILQVGGLCLSTIQRNWSCVSQPTFVADTLVPVCLEILQSTTDFRLQNAGTLLYVALADVLGNCSRVCAEEVEADTDFQLPSLGVFVARGQHVNSNSLCELFQRNPLLFNHFLESSDSRLLSLLALHRHPTRRLVEDPTQHIKCLDQVKTVKGGLVKNWEGLYIAKINKALKEPHDYFTQTLYRCIACQLPHLEITDLSVSRLRIQQGKVVLTPQHINALIQDLSTCLKNVYAATEILHCLEACEDVELQKLISSLLTTIDEKQLHGLPLAIACKLHLRAAEVPANALAHMVMRKTLNARLTQDLLEHMTAHMEITEVDKDLGRSMDTAIRAFDNSLLWTSYWRLVLKHLSVWKDVLDLDAWHQVLSQRLHEATIECRAAYSMMQSDEGLRLKGLLELCDISMPFETRLIGVKLLNSQLRGDRPLNVEGVLALLHVVADNAIDEYLDLNSGRNVKDKLKCVKQLIEDSLNGDGLMEVIDRLPEVLVSLKGSFEQALASFGHFDDQGNFVVSPDSAFEDEFANSNHLDTLLIEMLFDVLGVTSPTRRSNRRSSIESLLNALPNNSYVSKSLETWIKFNEAGGSNAMDFFDSRAPTLNVLVFKSIMACQYISSKSIYIHNRINRELNT